MARWINLANLFTFVRLVLVPFVIRAILEGRHGLALALFISAAVTDVLDGAAARHLGIQTQAGSYLDPIADKCLLSGVFLALAVSRLAPWWLVGIIFGRDIYILGAVGAALWLTRLRSFPPSVWGKVSTFVQIATAVGYLVRNVVELRLVDTFSDAMLWPCTAFTVWSGIHYTRRGIQLVRAH